MFKRQVRRISITTWLRGHLDGQPPKKVIYVPDKLVSIAA
jgi:hypothetical protein